MCPRQWFLNPASKREHELVTHFLIHSSGKPREVPPSGSHMLGMQARDTLVVREGFLVKCAFLLMVGVTDRKYSMCKGPGAEAGHLC